MNYPELEKIQAVKETSQAIGEFLAWLSGQGIILGRFEAVDGLDGEWIMPIYRQNNQLLADYFNIDLNKVEKERMALIESLNTE